MITVITIILSIKNVSYNIKTIKLKVSITISYKFILISYILIIL